MSEEKTIEQRPNILIFAKAFPPNLGGVETYSEQVAYAYVSLGFRPTVITQFSGEAGEAFRDGVSVINVGAGSQFFVFFRMLMCVRRLMRGREFKFSHATTWRVAIPLLILKFPAPVFLTVHGREVAQVTPILAPLMHWVFRRVAKIAVISQYSLDVCSKYEPALNTKSVVSWNGLSYRGLLNETEMMNRLDSRIKLFTACQLTVRKNVATILRAMVILKARGHNNITLDIAGDGPENASLKNLSSSLGLSEHVNFLGRVSRVKLPDFYRQATIFVHPQSHSHDVRDFESFCLAIADAMSFALPVIAGKDGAPAEYIMDGETGLIVDGKDEKQIADTIEFLVKNPERRDDMGLAAKKWAIENFSWVAHVNRLIENEIL